VNDYVVSYVDCTRCGKGGRMSSQHIRNNVTYGSNSRTTYTILVNSLDAFFGHLSPNTLSAYTISEKAVQLTCYYQVISKLLNVCRRTRMWQIWSHALTYVRTHPHTHARTYARQLISSWRWK